MTPPEIVDTLRVNNRSVVPDGDVFSREQVLQILDAASLKNFQFGSNVALSMIKGSLLVQLARCSSTEGM